MVLGGSIIIIIIIIIISVVMCVGCSPGPVGPLGGAVMGFSGRGGGAASLRRSCARFWQMTFQMTQVGKKKIKKRKLKSELL